MLCENSETECLLSSPKCAYVQKIISNPQRSDRIALLYGEVPDNTEELRRRFEIPEVIHVALTTECYCSQQEEHWLIVSLLLTPFGDHFELGVV